MSFTHRPGVRHSPTRTCPEAPGRLGARRFPVTAAACAALAAVLLAGCTSGAPPGAAADGSAALTPAAGGSASAGSTRVQIPAHGVNAAGLLTVRQVTPPSGVAAQAGVVPVGQAIQVGLTGARLTAPATVSFAAAARHFDGTQRVPVIVWQDTGSQWRWLPTTWRPGDSRVVAQTDHFSTGFLASVDVSALEQRAAQQVTDYLTGRSGVAQPTCGDEKAARAGVSVASDGGDTAKWCLGVDQGQTVLRIANNRRAYATVTYPQGWQVVDGGGGGISLDALVRSSAGGMQQVAAPPGMAVRLLSGGDTLTLSMPAGSVGHVTVEMDIIAWAFGGIVLGLDVWTFAADLANKAIGEASKGMAAGIIAKVRAGTADENWLHAWQDCTRAMSDHLADHPLAPMTDTSVARDVLKTVWGCVPALGKAWLTGNAQLAGVFLVSAVLAVVASVVSIVLTAANLIVTGVREVWDTFASFGGTSDPVYDVVLGPPPLPPNKTGAVTISGNSEWAFCTAFTLTAARQVLPQLPDQQMDGGDGNCTYYLDPTDLGAGDVSFVRPHVDEPGWATTAQTTAARSGPVTPITVGDGGFCAATGGGGFWVGWQRGTTGLEIDAGGPGATCDQLTRLARVLNASL